MFIISYIDFAVCNSINLKLGVKKRVDFNACMPARTNLTEKLNQDDLIDFSKSFISTKDKKEKKNKMNKYRPLGINLAKPNGKDDDLFDQESLSRSLPERLDPSIMNAAANEEEDQVGDSTSYPLSERLDETMGTANEDNDLSEENDGQENDEETIPQTAIQEEMAANQFERSKEIEKEKKKKEAEVKTEEEEKENPYKRIQRVLDFIKIFSGVTASMGDMVVSAPTFLIVAHGEWIFSKLVPKYKIPRWKKMLVVAVDIFIFLFFLILIAGLYSILDTSLGKIVAFFLK